MSDTGYRFFVGIDRGSARHDCFVLDGNGESVKHQTVAHSATAILPFAEWLAKLADGNVCDVAIATEDPHGAIIEALLDRGFHLFAINPKQLDRFRDRHSMAGAKDDRRDAFVLADSLRTDLKLYRRLEPSEPLVLALRELSRLNKELTVEFISQSNRLREQLHRYHSTLLSLCSAADEPWLWELLTKAPTPAGGARLRLAWLTQMLKRYRIRRFSAEELQKVLREQPLPVASGIVEAVSEHVTLLLPRLQLLDTQRRLVRQRLSAVLQQLNVPSHEEISESAAPSQRRSDVDVLSSAPGIGILVLSAILGEAAEAIKRRDYQGLRSYGGLAPVTKQSGKYRHVLMRHGCNIRLRNAFHYMANAAMQKDEFWRDIYTHLRARGQGHSRALRTIADRLLRRLMAMLETGSLYDGDLAQHTANKRQQASAMAT